MGPLLPQVPKPETKGASLGTSAAPPLTTVHQFCVLTIVQLYACVFSPTASTLVHATIIFYLKGDGNLLINIHVVLPPV